MPIETLIENRDGATLVRDRIAEILATESKAQQNLALAAGKNARLYELKVTKERAAPWGSFQDAQDHYAPIINVWFDTDNFEKRLGNLVDGQRAIGTFNVDCYGASIAKSAGISGYKSGDELAALEAERAAELCRNILMAAHYIWLGFKPGELVGSRWLQSRTKYQIEFDESTMQRVVGVRLAFAVEYRETAPQHAGQPLKYISVDLVRNDDGFLIAEVDHDYTQGA